ncbi:MAG: thioredoxin family protein, partial [Steroidobacteraceae bacterium]
IRALSANHKIPPDLGATAHARIDAALAPDHDRLARGDLVNAARITLEVLGEEQAAYDLLLKELPNAKTPYYYMSHLASLAEGRGDVPLALDWFAKAYAVSQGPATRVRWGHSYLRALIRLTPDDTARIRTAANDVLKDIGKAESSPDRLQASAARLTKALDKWATTPQRRAVALEIAQRMAGAAGAG